MVAMTKTERRIFRALQERPRSADELRDVVWWDHPNDGPECEKTIYVHLSNLRKRLNRLGLTVVCEPADEETLDRSRRKRWVGECRSALYKIKDWPGILPAHKFDSCGLYPG